jgi:transposase
VGIDVSKEFLDIARSDHSKPWQLPNDPDGITPLVSQLVEIQPACIVIESTGGFEKPVIAALLDAGLNVALVNPLQVRHLAKGLGFLAKTDAIDAQVLAKFAQLAAPRLLEKRSESAAELEALVTCRRQLVKTRVDQTNRLGVTASKTARKAINYVIIALNKQIAKLDKQIRDYIDSDDQWRHLDQIIQSAPGAGNGLSAMLLASLPEIGKLDHRQLAALVGVAPFNQDSGRYKGRRAICGGRADVRSVLYQATVTAMTHNPIIKTFGDRLKAAGKLWKVCVVACMRKFLTLLNTMVRENISWDQLDLVKNA